MLIASAKLPDEAGTNTTGTQDARESSAGQGKKAAPPPSRDRTNPTRKGDREQPGTASRLELPRPQIAVQINIAPDMTAEQIDQVFASMAKHLYSETSVD